jgi:hypothetical protein
MMKRYQTNHSNEVHQLIVTPSKHFFVTRNGVLKYQKKPFEIKLENCQDFKKTHIIHYIIRDHFSGLVYWETCTSDAAIPIHEFLFRSWTKKEKQPFYGMPSCMTIPKNVQLFFPGLVNFVETLGIEFIKVTSGFQGGVRDIRTIEDELRCAGLFWGDPGQFQTELPFELILEKSYEICTRLSDNFYRKPSKKETWLSGFGTEQKIFIPKSLELFRTTYQSIVESEY